MTCGEYREDLVEWARGTEPARALAVHVAECAGCARFLEEQRALSAVLRRVAAGEIPAAEEIGERVMAEFDRCARNSRIRVLGWFAGGAVAAAACLALLVTPHKVAPPEASGFIPIPYTIPLAPEERATVVRMEIPVSALISAGFQMSAADPGATVQADVVVSQDGRARAIRPISILSSN